MRVFIISTCAVSRHQASVTVQSQFGRSEAKTQSERLQWCEWLQRETYLKYHLQAAAHSLHVINQSCIKLTGENEAVVPMFFKGPQPIPLLIGLPVTEGCTPRYRPGNDLFGRSGTFTVAVASFQQRDTGRQISIYVKWETLDDFRLVLVSGPLWLFLLIRGKKKSGWLDEKLLWSLSAHNVHFLIVYVELNLMFVSARWSQRS